MDFKIVECFNRSITIELLNDTSYKADKSCKICIDGREAAVSDKNVMSIYGLEPDREYEITLEYEGEILKKSFKTEYESVLLNIRDFGAAGDLSANDAPALQAAISACPEKGTVYIPEGDYLCTPVFLKSNINIWIDRNARIIGNPDRKKYPVLPGMTRGTDEKTEYNLSSWEGNPLSSYASLITGIDVSNISIFGEGIIDGNAESSDWWQDVKVKRGAWRPNLLFLCRCTDIRVQGVCFKNSPSWTVHPYYSDRLKFMDISILNPYDSPNTDGFDPESCENVLLLGARISVGDDCIAIKSGKYYMSRYHFRRTRNVEIRNCLLEKGHGSVTIGSEVAAGVCDVRVSRCIFRDTDRGLRIKTRRGRGVRSVLDNIVFDNIRMSGVDMPFTLNMFYFCDPDGHSDLVQCQDSFPVDERTPSIKRIAARNIVCKDAGACFACFYGLPEMPVESIELENIDVSFRESFEPACPIMMDDFPEMSKRSIFAGNIKKLELRNVKIRGSKDKEPELRNVEEFIADSFQIEGEEA